MARRLELYAVKADRKNELFSRGGKVVERIVNRKGGSEHVLGPAKKTKKN